MYLGDNLVITIRQTKQKSFSNTTVFTLIKFLSTITHFLSKYLQISDNSISVTILLHLQFSHLLFSCFIFALFLHYFFGVNSEYGLRRWLVNDDRLIQFLIRKKNTRLHIFHVTLHILRHCKGSIHLARMQNFPKN